MAKDSAAEEAQGARVAALEAVGSAAALAEEVTEAGSVVADLEVATGVAGMVVAAVAVGSAAAQEAMGSAAAQAVDVAATAEAVEPRSDTFQSPSLRLEMHHTRLAVSIQLHHPRCCRIERRTQKCLCMPCRFQLQRNTFHIRMELQSPWYFEPRHSQTLRLKFECKFHRMHLRSGGGTLQTSKKLLD